MRISDWMSDVCSSDRALTCGPALPDGTVAGARAGSGNFSVLVIGKSGHAGRNPEEGRNAIVAAADLAVRLKASSSEGFSCNPARIEGGGLNNVVPDHAILHVNFRPRTPQDEVAAKAALNECIARSEEHTSELQSLMRISYAVFCLKNKNTTKSKD